MGFVPSSLFCGLAENRRLFRTSIKFSASFLVTCLFWGHSEFWEDECLCIVNKLGFWSHLLSQVGCRECHFYVSLLMWLFAGLRCCIM